MGGLFSLDNPIMQGLNKIIDCLFLSILWLLFCIPIVTIGASTSALYYTANKVIRNNRGYVWQQFWKGFKSSFKQATILWVILGLIMYLLWWDSQIVGVLWADSNLAFGAKVFFIIMMVLAALALSYVLPYIARFNAPVKVVAKNSIYMMFRHLPWTILEALILLVAAFLVWLIPIVIIVIPTIAAYVCSFIFERIFVKYMSEEDRVAEQKLNGKEYL